MQIGYEELSLYPEAMLNQICEFLGVQFTEAMLLPRMSHSHIGVGNRMRSQEGKLARISYDNRWFYRNEWRLQPLLLPFVMRYNSEQIYRNTRSRFWAE